MGLQLTLGLKLSSKTTLQNFIAGENKEFFESFSQNLIMGNPFISYIYGSKNSGKSHLLQGACHELAYRGLQAGYLDLQYVNDLEILKGLDHLKMIAFDNYECISPSSAEIFRSFIASSWSIRRQILIAGKGPLPQDFINTPHISTAHIRCLSLTGLASFLRVKATERGLCLPDDVQEYLVSHCENDPVLLLDNLKQIETRCEQEKKKISLKFARAILSTPLIMTKSAEDDDEET